MTKSLAAVLALLIAAAPAGAVEWQAMGPRALGMGGAGVAMAQGPLAAYWNPAALGRATENAYGLAVPFGVHAALTGTVVEGAKDLQNLRDAGGSATKAQIDEALNKLNDKNDGLRINALGGANFKVGKIAVFANGFVDMGAIPVVDLGHDTAGTINANTSKLVVKGARVTEIGAGYGHELPFAPGVFLGGNLKVMNAQVGYADYSIISNGGNGNNDLLKTLKNGAKTSSNFGVDLGALWDVDRTFPNATHIHLTTPNAFSVRFG